MQKRATISEILVKGFQSLYLLWRIRGLLRIIKLTIYCLTFPILLQIEIAYEFGSSIY